jgi:hypothetical protein
VLYLTLLNVLEEGLVRTMEDALKILQHASQPLGLRGADWLEQQERMLDEGRGR